MLIKRGWSNAGVHRLAENAFAAASPPLLSRWSRRPCRHLFRRPDRIVVLRGRALVRFAGLPRRIVENTEPSMGNLCDFCGSHISYSVRIVSGSEASASAGSAERSHDFHRAPAAAAAD